MVEEPTCVEFIRKAAADRYGAYIDRDDVPRLVAHIDALTAALAKAEAKAASQTDLAERVEALETDLGRMAATLAEHGDDVANRLAALEDNAHTPIEDELGRIMRLENDHDDRIPHSTAAQLSRVYDRLTKLELGAFVGLPEYVDFACVANEVARLCKMFPRDTEDDFTSATPAGQPAPEQPADAGCEVPSSTELFAGMLGLRGRARQLREAGCPRVAAQQDTVADWLDHLATHGLPKHPLVAAVEEAEATGKRSTLCFGGGHRAAAVNDRSGKWREHDDPASALRAAVDAYKQKGGETNA